MTVEHSIVSFDVSSKEGIHSLFIFSVGVFRFFWKQSLLQIYMGKFWQTIQWFVCAAACSLKNSVREGKMVGSSHRSFVVGELQKQECLFTCSMFFCVADATETWL